MASSIMAAASSSCSVSFSPITHPSSSSKPCPPLLPKKTNSYGLSLPDAKRVIFSSLISEKKNSSSATVKRGLEIRATTTGAAKTIEVEVDKPLGLTLDKLGFTKTAIEAKPNSVYFVVNSFALLLIKSIDS
ncbi:Quinate repressor protein [Bienertia sinuspersici]